MPTAAGDERDSGCAFCPQELPQRAARRFPCCKASIWPFIKASSSRSSGPAAAARARCCTCWPRSIAPDAGEICFEGNRIDNLPSAGRDILRNRYFGMVFQFYHLLPELTMLENVLMPAMIGAGDLRLSGEPQRESRASHARCSKWSASAIG